jgi:predicted nucleic acid-binding protein
VIVLDASFLVELLTNGALADELRVRVSDSSGPFAVPHLIYVEVTSAFRRLAAMGRIDSYHSERALAELTALPAQPYEHTALLGRVWELRHNFSAYDATYIALAEVLSATLYTCDRKMCKGHRARVVLFTDSEPEVFGR